MPRQHLLEYRVSHIQQTLSLPPITTLRGILGAAAGYNCEEIQEYVKDNEIKIGVTGTSQGRYRDLWKYAKLSPGRQLVLC